MISGFRWSILALFLLISPRTGFCEAFPIGDLLNDSLREGDTWLYYKSQFGTQDITTGLGYFIIKVDSIRTSTDSSVVYFSDRYFSEGHTVDYEGQVWLIRGPDGDHWRSTALFDFVKPTINTDTLIRRELKVSDDSTIEWSAIDVLQEKPFIGGLSKRYMKGYGLIYYQYIFSDGFRHGYSLTLELREFNGREFKYDDYKNIMDNSSAVKKRNKINYKASEILERDILGRSIMGKMNFGARGLLK